MLLRRLPANDNASKQQSISASFSLQASLYSKEHSTLRHRSEWKRIKFKNGFTDRFRV